MNHSPLTKRDELWLEIKYRLEQISCLIFYVIFYWFFANSLFSFSGSTRWLAFAAIVALSAFLTYNDYTARGRSFSRTLARSKAIEAAIKKNPVPESTEQECQEAEGGSHKAQFTNKKTKQEKQ